MNDPEINLWFSSWDRLQAIGVGAVFFFIFAIAIMRVSGKRTTAQMNNFDWIITVAIGSLASSGILLKEVSIADAALAIFLLALCQFLATWAVIQAPWVARLIKPTPRLLVHDGEILERAMRKERISTDELYGRLREHGFSNLQDVKWVILETQGKMTVIPKRNDEIGIGDAELMGNVKGTDGLKSKEEDDPDETRGRG